MNSRLLGRQLNLVETILVENKFQKHNVQIFDFLIILDFEATCWEKNDVNRQKLSEIIEFPAVLYDVKCNKILNEFQQYVMPINNPKLSDFCTNLTGITQKQVDDGVPLPTCLMLFSKWFKEQINKYNLTCDTSCPDANKKKCAFVTWSDWDLEICLHKECKGKRITKPEVFNKWIDLRALYLEHYNRRPHGLKGALSEVGLNFEGTEHCGLDDAKNTAFLAGRMISEGVLLRITKDLNVS